MQHCADLTDIAIFYWDGKPGSLATLAPDEYLVWDCDQNAPVPGWYWRTSPAGDPMGPFATEAEASADARNWS